MLRTVALSTLEARGAEACSFATAAERTARSTSPLGRANACSCSDGPPPVAAAAVALPEDEEAAAKGGDGGGEATRWCHGGGGGAATGVA